MRTAIPLSFALISVACLLPSMARAQQADARIVDLAGTTTAAVDAPPRSAFGRVMDVMIATLIADHTRQPKTRAGVRAQRTAQPAALQPATQPRAPAAARATPRIEITLGEGFELPPPAEVAVQARTGG